MYKAVIFDFFGVFCPDLSLEWFKTVPSYQAKLADFQAICTKSDYDKISREDFYKEVAVLANVPAAQAAQEIEANTAIDTELVQYVRSLRGKHYKTACLSNGTNEWTLRIITNYGLADLFDEIVLSGDIGIVKPNAGIYNETLRRLGVRPEEAIFVDDRQVNIDAAQALGIRSLLFTTMPAFIEKFERLTVAEN